MLVALSLLTLVSALITLALGVGGRRGLFYFFKPLTTLLIIGVALLAPPTAYGYAILAGLVFSLAGDVFLMLPERFSAGLASFLLAHLLYLGAFFADAGFGLAPWLLAPLAAFGAAVLARLWRRLGRLKLPVLLYLLVITAMAWQAGARWDAAGGTGPLLALVGALLFVLSDAALALERFDRPFKGAPALVLGTYYAAQWLIALSASH